MALATRALSKTTRQWRLWASPLRCQPYQPSAAQAFGRCVRLLSGSVETTQERRVREAMEKARKYREAAKPPEDAKGQAAPETQGKPLPQRYDSHFVEQYEDKLQRAVKEGQGPPKWIMMEQDINGRVKQIRSELLDVLSKADDLSDRQCARFSMLIDDLNAMIDDFNLECQILDRQRYHTSLDKEVARAKTHLKDD